MRYFDHTKVDWGYRLPIPTKAGLVCYSYSDKWGCLIWCPYHSRRGLSATHKKVGKNHWRSYKGLNNAGPIVACLIGLKGRRHLPAIFVKVMDVIRSVGIGLRIIIIPTGL